MSIEDVLREYGALGKVPRAEAVLAFWKRTIPELSRDDRRKAAVYVAAQDKWLYSQTVALLLEGTFESGEELLSYLEVLQEAAEHDSDALYLGVKAAAHDMEGFEDIVDTFFKREHLSPLIGAGLLSTWMERDSYEALHYLARRLRDAETGHHAAACVETIITAPIPASADVTPLFEGLRHAETLLSEESRFRLVDAYAHLSYSDPRQGEEDLLRLGDLGDDVQFRLAWRAGFDTRLDLGVKKEVLGKLLKSERRDLLGEVVIGLAHVGRLDSQWAISRLLELLGRDLYYRLDHLDYAFGELGRTDIEGSLAAIEGYVLDNPGAERYVGRDLVAAIISDNPKGLLPWLEKWMRDGDELTRLALRTISRVLSTKSTSQNPHILAGPIWDLLGKLCKTEVLEEAIAETKNLPQGRDPTVFRCLYVAKLLLYRRRPLRHEDIQNGWGRMGALRGLLGDDWLEEAAKPARRYHPLLYYLADSVSDEEVWANRASVFLGYLDDLADQMDPGAAGIASLRKGLINPEQFWQTLPELEVAARLTSHGIPNELQPPIDDQDQREPRRLDNRAEILETSVYIEIVTPQTYLPLELLDTAVGMPNRAVNIILEKVKEQLGGAVKLKDYPVVLVIDLTRTEITAYEIRDALLGQIKLEMLIDRKTGETVAERVIRDVNAISDKTREGRRLSGVIILRRSIDGNVRVSGTWIPNKEPLVPLAGKLLEILLEALFDHPLDEGNLSSPTPRD